MALITTGHPTYVHEQPDPSQYWVVAHLLNSEALICEVMLDIDGVLEVAIPANVVYMTPDIIIIEWHKPHTGIARIA